MVDEEIRKEDQVDVQKRYLMAKIDDLIDGVGPGYGKALMEELIIRMERTVGHFHEEITELLNILKSRASERNEKLVSLMKKEEGDITIEKKEPISSAEQEISDWEKKLEFTESEKEESVESETKKPPEEKKETKKKGLFKRKKK